MEGIVLKGKIHFSKIYLIGLLLTFGLFLLTGRQVYTHVTLNYAYDPAGEAIAAVYRGEEKLAEAEVIGTAADLYFWGADFTSISPIHYDTYEELYLTSVEIKLHGISVCSLNPSQMLENLIPNEGIRRLQIEEEGLNIMTDSDSPAFELAEELRASLLSAAGFISILNLLVFILLWTFIYWYLFKVLDLRQDCSYENLLDAVLGLVGVAAMLLAWGIAFTSAYGGTVHPDEMQTRAAIEYYRTHWIQPDVRSAFVAETVSGYGMTRLSEINLYYLFAGKFANLCGFPMAFRVFGMLLMLVLTGFILKNIKKERYIAVLFFLTPQLWYLFSYATSDAYDYLFTVFAAYEVLSERSVLSRLLSQKFQKKHIPLYLGIGFVFANLLMAKKTFYVVLLTMFMLLLYRLIFAKKEEKKQLFIKYLCLLSVAFAIVAVRYLPDFGYYGLNKSAAVEQVIEATAWPEYKPSTPAADQAKSTLLYEKGVSLKEFFTDWNFNGELLKNYFGYYGIYSLEAKPWYYALMGALYVALFVTIGVLLHQRIRIRQADGESVLQLRLTYWTMWGMIGLMYLLTIYNAYFVDFQPQGRYLFPALPALACQLTLDHKVAEHRAIRTLITAIAVLSLYSFYKIAYLNF